MRTFLVSTLCGLILLGAWAPVGRAQASSFAGEDNDVTAPDLAASDVAVPDVAASDLAALGAAATDRTAANSPTPRKAFLFPPLPFTAPLVGPVIKKGFPDDIDRWTTAFIPRNLDKLTPIEMPDTDERWIRVDLSEQTVVAYEGDRPIRAFIISSGLPGTPTVTGTFHIRTKVREQTMTGGSRALGNYYYLTNVEWVQYFYADYSFHGTYWHQKFGQPMSHGCLNMTNADAKWLFEWAGPEWDGKTKWYAGSEDNPGTLVIVHE